jgi:Zinc-finger associated domain (zf-AD)
MTEIINLIGNDEPDLATSDCDEFCRCCLVENEEFLDMRHEKFTYDGQEILLYEGFLKCSGLNPQVVLKSVKESSPKICKVCAALLENAYFFRGMCQNADKTVQKKTTSSIDKMPTRTKPADPEPVTEVIDSVTITRIHGPLANDVEPKNTKKVIVLGDVLLTNLSQTPLANKTNNKRRQSDVEAVSSRAPAIVINAGAIKKLNEVPHIVKNQPKYECSQCKKIFLSSNSRDNHSCLIEKLTKKKMKKV